METRPIMRTRKVIALSLISAGAAVLFGGCPAQPPGPCVVARTGAIAFEGANGNAYAVQYFFQAGSQTGDCTTDPAVAAWPSGDFTGGVWAEAYGAVTASKKLVGMVPDEFGWPNPYRNDVGLRDYVECTPTNNPLYAARGLPACVDDPIIFGNFTTDVEDSNNTCTITGTDAGTQLVNGVLVSYAFTNTLVYTNAAAGEGTQIQANVTITRASQTPGVAACVRNYVAIGLWPIAVCNVDNDCNPLPQPDNNPARPIGSGILTGIPVVCNLLFAAEDPIIVPNNIPQVPHVACAIDGMGTDTCLGFADGDAGVGNGLTVCSDLVATNISPAVTCSVDDQGNDSCDSATGPGGVCDTTAGVCTSVTGICAQAQLDRVGCGTGVVDGGLPFITLSGGCAGPAKDNNGTGGTNVCFFAGPGPTTFPYLTTSSN
jgi:hypothetical protein